MWSLSDAYISAIVPNELDAVEAFELSRWEAASDRTRSTHGKHEMSMSVTLVFGRLCWLFMDPSLAAHAGSLSPWSLSL